MKVVLAAIAEFVLFLLLDVVGGVFYHPFHIQTALASTPSATRSFAWDGVLFLLIAWLILLLFSLTRRRFVAWAPQFTAAMLLAALAGYLLKVGFVTHNW